MDKFSKSWIYRNNKRLRVILEWLGVKSGFLTVLAAGVIREHTLVFVLLLIIGLGQLATNIYYLWFRSKNQRRQA